MSRIELPNTEFLKDVKKVKFDFNDEYEKLVQEADEKIETSRKNLAQVYKSAKNCIARSSSRQIMDSNIQLSETTKKGNTLVLSLRKKTTY